LDGAGTIHGIIHGIAHGIIRLGTFHIMVLTGAGILASDGTTDGTVIGDTDTIIIILTGDLADLQFSKIPTTGVQAEQWRKTEYRLQITETTACKTS
jgi:hypothetical protein